MSEESAVPFIKQYGGRSGFAKEYGEAARRAEGIASRGGRAATGTVEILAPGVRNGNTISSHKIIVKAINQGNNQFTYSTEYVKYEFQDPDIPFRD